MPELVLWPETLILELQRAVIISMVKHKGTFKQEWTWTSNTKAGPGLSENSKVMTGTWNTKICCSALCCKEHLESVLKQQLVPLNLLHCNYEQLNSQVNDKLNESELKPLLQCFIFFQQKAIEHNKSTLWVS